MLGLGNTLTASDPVEGIIQLGDFGSFSFSGKFDDENVQIYATTSDSAMLSLLGYAAASSGDKLGGTFSLTVTRLDSSGNAVAGAATTGTVHAYKFASNLFFLTNQDSSNINLANFNAEGSALLDLTSFGDVTDITNNSETFSTYNVTLTVTGAGHTTASVSVGPVTINKA
jgi:hypothetical protein